MKITFREKGADRIKCHESALPNGFYRGKVRGHNLRDTIFMRSGLNITFFNGDKPSVTDPNSGDMVDCYPVEVELVVYDKE